MQSAKTLLCLQEAADILCACLGSSPMIKPSGSDPVPIDDPRTTWLAVSLTAKLLFSGICWPPHLRRCIDASLHAAAHRWSVCVDCSADTTVPDRAAAAPQVTGAMAHGAALSLLQLSQRTHEREEGQQFSVGDPMGTARAEGSVQPASGADRASVGTAQARGTSAGAAADSCSTLLPTKALPDQSSSQMSTCSNGEHVCSQQEPYTQSAALAACDTSTGNEEGLSVQNGLGAVDNGSDDLFLAPPPQLHAVMRRHTSMVGRRHIID